MTCGRGLKSIGVSLLLLLALSVPTYSDAPDPSGMTTEEIVAELTQIISEQETRLNEAESLLTEQETTLRTLRRRLSELSESYTQQKQAIDGLRSYSQSLEGELQKVRMHRAVLLTISGISIVVAVVGWLF